MKFRIMLIGATLLAGMADGSFADCTDSTTQVVDDSTNPTALFDLLKNNTVCVSNGSGGWENQEYHSTTPDVGGSYQLIDYKLGSDPKDPTGPVGTWRVSGSGANTIVTYQYTDGGTYSYTVHTNGPGSLFFCEGTSPHVTVTYKTGLGACP